MKHKRIPIVVNIETMLRYFFFWLLKCNSILINDNESCKSYSGKKFLIVSIGKKVTKSSPISANMASVKGIPIRAKAMQKILPELVLGAMWP